MPCYGFTVYVVTYMLTYTYISCAVNASRLYISLSAHRRRSSSSAVRAPCIPFAVPHVILGNDRATHAVVVRRATQARLVPAQLISHRLLHRHCAVEHLRHDLVVVRRESAVNRRALDSVGGVGGTGGMGGMGSYSRGVDTSGQASKPLGRASFWEPPGAGASPAGHARPLD